MAIVDFCSWPVVYAFKEGVSMTDTRLPISRLGASGAVSVRGFTYQQFSLQTLSRSVARVLASTNASVSFPVYFSVSAIMGNERHFPNLSNDKTEVYIVYRTDFRSEATTNA